MISKVYSNKAKPGWLYRAGGWPCDKKHKPHRLYMSWHFDVHWRDAEGKEARKKESGFISAAEAAIAGDNFKRAILRTRYGIVELQPAPTLAQLIKTHIAKIDSKHEKIRANRVLNLLVTECSISLLPVNKVTSEHLSLFVDVLKRQQLLPSTINRDLNIVSAAFNAGRLYFAALEDWRPPKIPRPKHSKRRRERIIQVEEITRLLTYLCRAPEARESAIAIRKRRNVAHVFRMALLTASRKGEIRQLRWDQIDWRAGMFQLIGTKNEFSQVTTARYPKITPTIAAIFRERWATQCKGAFPSKAIVMAPMRHYPNRGCRYVFTSNGGEVTHYYDIISKAAQACGLLYGRKVLGGFVTHDTRHTAVSYLLDLGYDLKTIGELTGHTDETLVLLYSHVKRSTVLAAYDDLEKQFAGTGTLGRVE